MANSDEDIKKRVNNTDGTIVFIPKNEWNNLLLPTQKNDAYKSVEKQSKLNNLNIDFYLDYNNFIL